MISEFSCPGGAREPISPTQLRWLDHYYRMKCEISAEDASWKILT